MSRTVTKSYAENDMSAPWDTTPLPCDTLRRGRAILTADDVVGPFVGNLLVRVSNQPAPDQSRRQAFVPAEDTFVTAKTVAVSLTDAGQSTDTGSFDLTCTYVRFIYQSSGGEGAATLRVVLAGDEE